VTWQQKLIFEGLLMKTEMNTRTLDLLAKDLAGDLYHDMPNRLIYATDASAYREIPVAVARPANIADIKRLIQYAGENHITLVPRTAGTSLAGQVVGNGIIVDVSKYFTNIHEINASEGFVRLQPGVILDELNLKLAEYGMFFGPETSTSNRCMIGGMVGNNACGAHSLIYGSTRDHLKRVDTLLSDGSEVSFSALGKEEFLEKSRGSSLENKLYRQIHEILSVSDNREEIIRQFPDPLVRRRNNGYALDLLLDTVPFKENGAPFNFSTLLAGSEGTLAFLTEIVLNLVPLPPKIKGLVCIHFHTLEEALLANLICLKYKPGAVELMDSTILDCTKANIEQRKNRFFIQGDPGAILIVEFARQSMEEILDNKNDMEAELRGASLGYHFPVVTGPDISKVWALRKSGLGVLSNMPGDAKPVSLIEDTAIRPDLLPAYIGEFRKIMDQYGLNCVYHAHVATGELHLRPVLNLKDPEGVHLFRTVAKDVALLVKKYRGSLSGEHGDGRLRGEFIPIMVGERNYDLMKQVKNTWDPSGIFNKGKITDTPRMDTSLRYKQSRHPWEDQTVFDFSSTRGLLRHAEQCNGSGDCRKPAVLGGTMCPSYMATRDERTTTRARANLLREYMSDSGQVKSVTISAVYDVLDLCLSCKGCKSECPSNVDMAKLKAEFLQHYYDKKGVSLPVWLIAHIGKIHKINSRFPAVYNTLFSNKFISGTVKSILGFAAERKMPLLSSVSFEKWLALNGYFSKTDGIATSDKPEVCLFLDEFTNFLDAEKGIAAAKLLTALGYKLYHAPSSESGRTYISKGLLRKARKIANRNIVRYGRITNENRKLVGIEPSALLTFRDEYPELASAALREEARRLSGFCMTIEEFIAAEFEAGRIRRDQFTTDKLHIYLHGHCQQKAIASTMPAKTMLTIPENYTVEEIKSGCCGMAGAFGYEKRHFVLSMKIGEMVLFPAIRKAAEGSVITAAGTSCRQQIEDGTGVHALHPVEILFQALKDVR
jgi:FAD/FMN-containing dehydrogenase/Fe-S oxidoreductase